MSNTDGTLSLYQRIATSGAIDLAHFTLSNNNTYLVIANGRDNTGNVQRNVQVYLWNRVQGLFQISQSIPAYDVRHIYSFQMNNNSMISQWRFCGGDRAIVN